MLYKVISLQILIGLCFCFSSFNLLAAIGVYEFKDETKQLRFQQLTAELRCPKCQNQNLADSNAEIAQDLRTKVYQMLQAEKADAEIIEYMLARYGEFVLYKPRLTLQTALLWYGPFLLLAFGIIIIGFILRQRAKTFTEVNKNTLPSVDNKKLAALLNPTEDKK